MEKLEIFIGVNPDTKLEIEQTTEVDSLHLAIPYERVLICTDFETTNLADYVVAFD